MARSNSNNRSVAAQSPDKKKLKKKLWISGIIFFAIVLTFLFGGDGIWQSLRMNVEVNELQSRVDSLKELNDVIYRRVDGLKKGDEEILEEEARRYNMIKPGEKVFVLASGQGSEQEDAGKTE